MPIQDQLFKVWTCVSNLAGLKRKRVEAEESSAQEETASLCKKLKSSPVDLVFGQPDLLKQVFSMLDAPSQVRLNTCSKTMVSIRFDDGTSLVDADALRNAASEFVKRFEFPLATNIHSDPVEAAKIIYRELKFDHYINRYLERADHVTFAQKLAYMMHGRKIPAFATDNLHETNKRLDQLCAAAYLNAAECKTPIPKQVSAFLDAVENRLAAGQRDRAWVQANLAYTNCTENRVADIRAIHADRTHTLETKTIVLLGYLKCPPLNECIEATIALHQVVLGARGIDRRTLSQVEGLLASLAQLLLTRNHALVHDSARRIIRLLGLDEVNVAR